MALTPEKKEEVVGWLDTGLYGVCAKQAKIVASLQDEVSWASTKEKQEELAIAAQALHSLIESLQAWTGEGNP